MCECSCSLFLSPSDNCKLILLLPLTIESRSWLPALVNCLSNERRKYSSCQNALIQLVQKSAELDSINKRPHAREALLSCLKYAGTTQGTTLNASPPQVSVPQMTPCESMMSEVKAKLQPGVFCQLNTNVSVQPLGPGLNFKSAYSVMPHRLPLASKVRPLGKSSAGSVKRLKLCK